MTINKDTVILAVFNLWGFKKERVMSLEEVERGQVEFEILIEPLKIMRPEEILTSTCKIKRITFFLKDFDFYKRKAFFEADTRDFFKERKSIKVVEKEVVRYVDVNREMLII
jgi:hypothetical protein